MERRPEIHGTQINQKLIKDIKFKSFRGWSKASKAGQKLQRLVKSFRGWSKASEAGQKLQRLVKSFRGWSKASKTGQKLQRLLRLTLLPYHLQ
jgi:hypothetical protein